SRGPSSSGGGPSSCARHSRRVCKGWPFEADSAPTLEDGLPEPHQRRTRLDPLGLLEKRLESRIAVVLLVGLMIGGDHVEDVVLDAGMGFGPALHAHEAALQKTAAAGE